MLILYRIITAIIYYLIYVPARLAAGRGSLKWRHRLGNHDLPPESPPHEVWFHASSMGEVKVLAIILNRLKKERDHLRLYVTAVTETGYSRARELLGAQASIGFLPLDSRRAATRFLNNIRPQAAVIIETEIWPNIICELGRQGIPLILANGRLSADACKKYLWFKSGLRKVFRCYRALMVQTNDDKKRYVKIGADPELIEVTGNLKFDAPVAFPEKEKVEALRQNLPFEDPSRIFIAGSTRNKENEIIIGLYRRLRRSFPDLKLILAPRHPKKTENILRAVEKMGLSCKLYSYEDKSKSVDVLVIDKMGLLNDLYAVSDIAFVGGTLVKIGGHNILEPVWAGIPVLYGPSIFNVRDSSDYIIKNGYGEMVGDESELYDRLHGFFEGQISYRKKPAGHDIESGTGLTINKIMEYLEG